MLNHRTEFLCVLAEMYGMNNQPCKGLELIDEALVFMENGDERYHEAELYRMRGILLLQLDEINVQQAEAEFLKSIKVARQMKAKSCELRTAISLVRMWLTLGYEEKLQDAQSILSEVYGWFTEGFGTRDLKEARELLSAKQK